MLGIIPITITSPPYRTYPYHLHHQSLKICMVYIPPPIPIAAGRQLHIVPSPLNGFFWLFPTTLNIFSFVFFINEIVTRCYYFCCNCRNNIIIDYLVIVIKKLPPPTFIVSQYIHKSCIHNFLKSLVVVRPPHMYLWSVLIL